MRLRSYSTLGRAIRYARTLQACYPDSVFDVRLSPFTGYAFRWLIFVRRASGEAAWVGR